jgi:hypothetical protein
MPRKAILSQNLTDPDISYTVDIQDGIYPDSIFMDQKNLEEPPLETISETEVRWIGGGSIIVIETQEGLYLPVGFRDNGAPVFKNRLGTASGTSDTIEELLYPEKIAARESLEEVLVYDTVADSWVTPKYINREKLDQMSYEIIEDVTTELLSRMELPVSSDITSRPAARYDLDSRTFLVKHPIKDIERKLTGYIEVEPTIRASDFLDVYYLDMSHRSISDIQIYDGELLETEVEFPQRDIFIFTENQYRNLFTGSEKTAERLSKSGYVYSSKQDKFVQDYEKGSKIRFNSNTLRLMETAHSRVLSLLDKI